MKTCPVCKARLFEDMDTCYGCMHRFDEDEPMHAEVKSRSPRFARVLTRRSGRPSKP